MGIFSRRPTIERRLASVWTSETGLVRKDNQDSVFVDDSRQVYCVADGMGGAAEGARASDSVCRHVRDSVRRLHGRSERDCRSALEAAVAAANGEVFAYSRERGYDQMGSTVVLLSFIGDDAGHALVGHVGDSRAYRIRGGMSTRLTRDHTVGFELGDVMGASAKSFRERTNPLAHVLTRAVGVSDFVNQDWQVVDVRPGDRFVICSDGVHDVVSDARLAVFAGGGTLLSARDRLSAEIISRGAPDNYSFVIVEVGRPA